jgi:hypothetical protein
MAAIATFVVAPAWAQVTQVVTGFETNREGDPLAFQPASFGDLKVVMFQDPREADVTAANVVADIATSTGLPSTEESFVANFVGDGFFGAGGSSQSLDVRFQWAVNTNGARWVLLETLQSPLYGDPSVHLDGTVSFKLNLPMVESEFPLLEYTDRIGVALLIRETGANIPVGFRDPTFPGRLEFVGVTAVNSNGIDPPVPVPSLYINGPTSSGDQGWINVSFNLNTAPVIGWASKGGNGVLDASDLGVNRGSLAGIVLTVDPSDISSQYLEVLLDDITISSPVNDPTYPPTVNAPVVQGQTSVRVKDVLSSATNVSLEIDRSDGNNEDPFVADQTVNSNPAGALFKDFAGLAALQVGDRLRARQTNSSGTSAYSIIVNVNPPAAFTCTITLDEDGNNGLAPADFEFVGAAALNGGAPQGKPIPYAGGTWQKVEFSLIPGVEPVIDFAGGNGQLQPDGGNYNIDALWFSIDPTEPNAGPYEVYLDHLYYIASNDAEVLMSNAEAGNPFPSLRGQSTTAVFTTALSSNASYDGFRSDRFTWTWPDAATTNLISYFRPGVVFPDTAKAVGFYLYVVPPATSLLNDRPLVQGPLVGAVASVPVDLTTTGVTQVQLFKNGALVDTLNSPSDPAIFTTAGVVLGDVFTATQTTALATSDLSNPRRTTTPGAPRLQLQPITDASTSITVFDVYNLAGSTASLVTVATNGVAVASIDPAGASTIAVPLGNTLDIGDVVTATQTVNGLTSPASGSSLVISGIAPCVAIYREDFEVDPTASWTLNGGPSDEAASFFFDYTTLAGIPQAPNSRGTGTHGMKLQANLTSGIFGGMSVSPTGKSFTGDYTLAFDWWANFNGPFPAGGSGSTNLSTYGILTNGTTAQWPGNANGVYFGGTADGGSGTDWRAYSPAAQTSYASGNPVYAALTLNNTDAYYASFGGETAPAAQLGLFPNQTGTTQVGSGGMAWHEVTVAKNGAVVTWRIDGVLMATIDTSAMTLGGSNILFGHSDINATNSTDPNAPGTLFTLIDNVRVLVKRPESAGAADWDGDGNINLADYAELAGCLFGPGVLPDRFDDGCVNTCLDAFDFTSDGDVDLADFAHFADLF